MGLYKATSKTLWIGAVLGIAIIAAGLAVNILGYGEGVLWLGLLILIVSPMLGVVVSAFHLLKDRDYAWAMVALVLIAMTVISIAITLYLD
mgnify:CR=1 FL=1